MKKLYLVLSFLLVANTSGHLIAQSADKNNGDWKEKVVSLKDTEEADFMIRVGDIDNMGFGWQPNYSPFSNKQTIPHGWPWDPKEEDPYGTDRVIMMTSYKGYDAAQCGNDGYSATERPYNLPQPIKIPLAFIQKADIKKADLTLAVEDFQSPKYCSRFRVWINGTMRFTELEDIIFRLNQTSPMSNMVTVNIPEKMFPLLKGSELSIMIDDSVTHAGDGFAVDFVKLVINRKKNLNVGIIVGTVRAHETGLPIPGAIISILGKQVGTTDPNGDFKIDSVSAGMQLIEISTKKTPANVEMVEVVEGETSNRLDVYLDLGKKVFLGDKMIEMGKSVVLENVKFGANSAALTTPAKEDLDKVVKLSSELSTMQIELGGYTDNGGEAETNQKLSERRVESCKAYLVSKGMDASRITTVGHGQSKPIATNNTPEGRAKNRRVEVKIVKF